MDKEGGHQVKLTGVCDGLEQGRVVDCRGLCGGSTDGEATAGSVLAREIIIHGETVVASVDVAVRVCVGRILKGESLGGLVGESSSGRRRGRGAAHGEAPAVGRARVLVHYSESGVACDGAAQILREKEDVSEEPDAAIAIGDVGFPNNFKVKRAQFPLPVAHMRASRRAFTVIMVAGRVGVASKHGDIMRNDQKVKHLCAQVGKCQRQSRIRNHKKSSQVKCFR